MKGRRGGREVQIFWDTPKHNASQIGFGSKELCHLSMFVSWRGGAGFWDQDNGSHEEKAST